MRPSLPLALAILLAATTSPSALASPSSLQMELPPPPLGPDETIRVNVTLVIHDFMCSEARDFTVLLAANATFGVKATFAKTNLTFTTPPHTYFAEPYRQTQSVNLTVRALTDGDVELTAVFPEHAAGPCLVPDGFQPSSTTVVARAQGPPPDAAEEDTPPATTNATDENNATDDTNATPTPASPTPRAPSPPATGTTPCAPDTECGYIGEFAPGENTRADAPGAGVVAALAAVAAGAVLLRRKT